MSEYRDKVAMSLQSNSGNEDTLQPASIVTSDAINEYGDKGTWERQEQHLKEAQKNFA